MVERVSLSNEGKIISILPVLSVVGAVCIGVSSSLAASCPETKFPYSQRLSFTGIGGSEYSHIWGKENMKISEAGVVATYPKGSFSPSNGDVRGGGGFIYTPSFLSQAEHTKLSYTLRFAKNFDFVKGGKLPGLCAGDCPRGGNAEEKGFSTRFMWRRRGDLEVYGYFPGTAEQSIGRGMFRFEPGKQYQISQEVKVNTPGKKDGIVRVFIEGKCIYENTTIDTSDFLPNKIIFSTFFGGADSSWATPVDTSIEFGDFTVEWK